MPTFTQAERLMHVVTPLGPDVLLLAGFSGREAISTLYSFQVDLLAENKTEVAFDKLLGQAIAVGLKLPKGKQRNFTGICSRLSEGKRDTTFTHYRMEVVPALWLLTRRVQSRIFQQMSVPDILKKVMAGLDVTFELQGTFFPRDYCVQYRESDFAFASRLMEEEGIYYFFKHSADSHKLVVANAPSSHSELPDQPKVIYEEIAGGQREEMRVYQWEKLQELRSGKYTLWDHCFELPHKHLEAEKVIADGVQVGKIKHKFRIGGNDKLEIYKFPGEYAQRFDGVDRGGGDKPADLQKIFEDNKRTAEIRMQQEALPGLTIRGASNCRQFVPGFKFALDRHFNADGTYVLTAVEHRISFATDYRSGEGEQMVYENSFSCIPLELPFRPARTTPKPVMQGTQTAVVVGPPGEEIFTDKYSRIKVQFHWDREGKNDANSSCWIRVATNWAGKQWGFLQIPRIGQEVIVDFLEGDADNPIVIGSVYNAEQMPSVKLPAEKASSGLKSNSTPGGGGYNGMIVNDTKGKELIKVHGQFDMDSTIEHDLREHVLNNRTRDVTNNESITVGVDKTVKVGANHTETITANQTIQIGSNQSVTVGATKTETIAIAKALTIGAGYQVSVGAGMNETIGGVKAEEIGGAKIVAVGGISSELVGGRKAVKAGASISESAGANFNQKAGANFASSAGGKMDWSAGGNITIDGKAKIVIKAADEIGLTCGGASIILKSGGEINIKGTDITVDGSNVIIKGSGEVGIKGSTIKEN